MVLAEMMEGKSDCAMEAWRNACVEGGRVSGAEKEDSRAKAFKRALETLCRAGVVEKEGGRVRWVVSTFEEFEDIGGEVDDG